jgi:hypothetical protein
MVINRNEEIVDFFIVGAMKSGTSSLKSFLNKHPELDMLPIEAHYFSDENNYSQGEKWYHGLFETNKEGRLRGEKSPPYSVTNHSPIRIHTYNPDAKIVWLFRNPVDRAISHFYHAKKRTQDAITLTTAINNAESLEQSEDTQAYIYRSEYIKHIQKFEQFFPQKNMHIMIFEELISNTNDVVKGLYEFLGVDSSLKFKLPHRNIAAPDIVDEFQIDAIESDKLKAHLRPVVDQMESLLGRQIPTWR